MNLGLGTAAIGRPKYINIRLKPETAKNLQEFRARSIGVLDFAYKQGIRYFDTAPGYGMAEELVMRSIKTKDDQTINIATKWGYTYTANFDPNAKTHEVKEHSLAKLNEQWHISKDLHPYLKVYQIHSATNESNVLQNKEVLTRLHEIKQTYNLKIGITTTGDNQTEIIKKALDISVDKNQLFDVFQVTYNILDQSLMSVYNELKNQNKSIVIKEALANGRLFRQNQYPNYNKMYNTIEAIAETHNVKVDAVLLRYCMQTIPASMVLSGAATVDQLNDNLKANTIVLNASEIEQLNQFKLNTTAYWQERKRLVWN